MAKPGSCFGPLAKRYRALVSEKALFGASRITNLDFLHIYQEARCCVKLTIPGAWRGVGLVPFDPERLLSHYTKKEKGVPADKRFVGDLEAEELGKKVAQITGRLGGDPSEEEFGEGSYVLEGVLYGIAV